MIEKAAASVADAVCIDLEDAVAPSEKEASRANVIHALMHLDFGHSLRMYRINALDTPYAYRDLIEIVEAAGDHLVATTAIGNASLPTFAPAAVDGVRPSFSELNPGGIVSTLRGVLDSPRAEAATISNPADLLSSTFLTGGDATCGQCTYALSVDASSATYIAGYDGSNTFPTTPGAFQTSSAGSDAIVTKLTGD